MDLGIQNDIQTQSAARALESQIAGARRAAQGGDVDAAALAFEELLATMLVRELNKTLPEGFFGEGVGSDTFNGWLEEHLGSALADTQALGIAESVRASLIRKQHAPEPAGDGR